MRLHVTQHGHHRRQPRTTGNEQHRCVGLAQPELAQRPLHLRALVQQIVAVYMLCEDSTRHPAHKELHHTLIVGGRRK